MKLLREVDGHVHTLAIVPVKVAKGVWEVHVVDACLELSTWPIAATILKGGEKKSDTKPVIERALAKARREGWADELAPEERARIDAHRKALVTDLATRLEKFPASTLDRRLAAAIAKPKGVTELDLRGGRDRLTVVPPSIQALTELEVLHLESNTLRELPETLGQMHSLRALHLAHNDLRVLPRGVWFLPRLVVLDLHGNPIIPSQNLGNYQQPGLELQVGGTARAIQILPFHKLRVLGTDTDNFFPLEIDGTFPLEVLHLYGRTPTKKELSSAKRVFPSAKIEVFERVSDGPAIVTEIETSKAPLRAPKKKELHADHHAELDAILGLAKKHRIAAGDVRAHVIPYVALTTRPAKKSDLAPGKTRMGGSPDLVSPWPRGPEGPMLFVAQLDLSEIAPYDIANVFPPAGLLSFFVADFDMGKVIFSEGAVKPAKVPDDVHMGGPCKPLPACGVDIRGVIAIDFQPKDAKEGAKWAAFSKACRKLRKSSMHGSLFAGVDDADIGIATDDIVLLWVGSDDRADMMWGDCGSLYFVVDPKSLASRAFDRVRVLPTP